MQGPEPEAIDTGVVGHKTYAFIGLERNSGIFVYDITKPDTASFVQYVVHREFLKDGEKEVDADLGPEYVLFIAAKDSPIEGTPLLVAANEVRSLHGTTPLALHAAAQSGLVSKLRSAALAWVEP